MPEKISLKKKEEKSFNKEMCKSLASSLPERANTDLQSLKNIMQLKTKNLSEKKSLYCIFMGVS